jgi:hypothetical protein
LSVGALGVDRCPQLDESLDQAELTGDDAPVKGTIAQRIARPGKLRSSS